MYFSTALDEQAAIENQYVSLQSVCNVKSSGKMAMAESVDKLLYK